MLALAYRGTSSPVIRLLAAFLCAALSLGAVAADKPAKARKVAAIADVTRDGEPNLLSSGVFVLDPVSGQTLFAKNADHAAPIASITKLMTAMVVVDANLAMDE